MSHSLIILNQELKMDASEFNVLILFHLMLVLVLSIVLQDSVRMIIKCVLKKS